MSEQENEAPKTPSSSSSIWGFFASAKEKSAYVFEALKKDLDEIKTEAAVLTGSLNNEDENSTVNVMKKSISNFFGTVSEALNPTGMLEDETEAVLITNDDTIVLTGFHKHLAELQANDKIYLEEPCDELAEKYKRWLEVVEQDQFTQNRIDRLLANSEILKDKYEKFVPDQVSHMNFWKRYLFKKALLEDELAEFERRQRAEAATTAVEAKEDEVIEDTPNAEAQIQTTQPKKSSEPIDELNWEADFELSEEEQARLLAEYEQEIKEREGKGKIDLAQEISESEAKAKTTPTKSTITVAASTSKTSNVQKKNQKSSSTSSTATTSNNKNNVQSKKPGANTNPKSKTKQQQQNKKTDKEPETATTSEAAAVVADNKGELNIEKDHFNKDENSSTNSDESWIEV